MAIPIGDIKPTDIANLGGAVEQQLFTGRSLCHIRLLLTDPISLYIYNTLSLLLICGISRHQFLCCNLNFYAQTTTFLAESQGQRIVCSVMYGGTTPESVSEFSVLAKFAPLSGMW